MIIGRTQKEVKKSMMEIMNAGENIGLSVNMKKSKYKMMTRKIGNLSRIIIGNNRIK